MGRAVNLPRCYFSEFAWKLLKFRTTDDRRYMGWVIDEIVN